MNFKEAVNALFDGKSIRVNTWDDKEYIKIVGKITILFNGDCYPHAVNIFNYNTDLHTWELYEEKTQLKDLNVGDEFKTVYHWKILPPYMAKFAIDAEDYIGWIPIIAVDEKNFKVYFMSPSTEVVKIESILKD